MKTRKEGNARKTPVKGGWVKRDSITGRLLEAGTSKTTSKASQKTESVIKSTSSKRGAALKRLVDR